jgi:hypothetical protein
MSWINFFEYPWKYFSPFFCNLLVHSNGGSIQTYELTGTGTLPDKPKETFPFSGSGPVKERQSKGKSLSTYPRAEPGQKNRIDQLTYALQYPMYSFCASSQNGCKLFFSSFFGKSEFWKTEMT